MPTTQETNSADFEILLPHIMIIDDEIAQMRALCDTLSEQGYQTTGFTSGELALIALQNTSFDLLLSDLMMPKMDGITLLQAALVIDPSLVGVIMTGEGTISTAVEAMKVGAFDYILKPFKLSAILPVLSRALAIKQLRIKNAALEQELREYTTKLEAANQELEAFSYSVSHDLRAPLRSIDGFSLALLEDYADQLDDEGKSYLNRVRAATQRMGSLIDDMLELSRIARVEMRHSCVDLSVMANEILQELSKSDENRIVKFEVEENLIAEGDPKLLRIVLDNLISNAWKYTSKLEEAHIKFGSSVDSEDIVNYYVRDNGAGFDMVYADKLFSAFQRLHTHSEFPGTGVGLATVQRIIHRHGGKIYGEGKPNQGATFFFTLTKSKVAEVSIHD